MVVQLISCSLTNLTHTVNISVIIFNMLKFFPSLSANHLKCRNSDDASMLLLFFKSVSLKHFIFFLFLFSFLFFCFCWTHSFQESFLFFEYFFFVISKVFNNKVQCFPLKVCHFEISIEENGGKRLKLFKWYEWYIFYVLSHWIIFIR